MCRCGHPRGAHRHYRPGSDCGLCGCHEYQRTHGFLLGMVRREREDRLLFRGDIVTVRGSKTYVIESVGRRFVILRPVTIRPDLTAYSHGLTRFSLRSRLKWTWQAVDC